MNVGGHRLELRRIGPRAGPQLVFLHEGLGSIETWKDWPERVAGRTGLGALVYDRLGYGRSDAITPPRPLRYMHDEAVVLGEILDQLDIDEAILVGHSDGASIAILHAGVGSRRVKAAVLLAPHVFCEAISVASIADAAVAYQETDLRDKLARYHDDVDGAFWGWNLAWLDPAFRDWNIEDALPGITVPVLLVQGEDDAYGTLAQIDAVAKGVRGRVERRILPRCGHSPQRDQPDATTDAVVSFVASLAPVGR